MTDVGPKEEIAIPSEVLSAYYGPDEEASGSLLSGGEIHATYLVESSGRSNRKAILQQLGSMFGKAMLEDYGVVTEYLGQQGWEVPELIPTQGGEPFTEDNDGNLWRLTTFIKSDGYPVEREVDPDGGFYEDVGAILARFHETLKSLDYQPQFKIEHFHETDYYAARLKEVAAQLSPDDAERAQELLKAHKNLPKLPGNDGGQLIHGDPRTDNILFREGKPFTYIDLDTTMLGSVWLDIGDLLRSLAEDSMKRAGSVDIAQLRAVTEGYRSVSASETDPDEFFGWSVAAMQQIALELGMRYMIDIVEDYYFTWDTAKFSSRRESHLARVAEQLQIYQSVK